MVILVLDRADILVVDKERIACQGVGVSLECSYILYEGPTLGEVMSPIDIGVCPFWWVKDYQIAYSEGSGWG